jgi:iron complex outermembrane receptor protein
MIGKMERRATRARLLAAAMTATALAAGINLIPETALAQDHAGARSYDIRAGSLTDALNQLAEQSGLQLNYEAALTQGRTVSALRGRFPASEALTRLLSGTGLVARPAGENAMTLSRATTGVMSLDPLEVKGFTRASYGAELDDDEETRSGRDGTTIIVRARAEQKETQTSSGPWGVREIADTPYSVSVMSSQQIENTIARDLDQLYKMNPVVQVNAPMTIFGYPSVLIRGFNQSTGIVDGVRLSSYTYGVSAEEIEKVEVMNGLSGFTYGAGNVGGVSNYVLKRPTHERLTNLTVGNYGGKQYFAHADLGGEIDSGGLLAYRFNAAYADGDTSKDDQQLKKWLVSGAIDVNLADNLLVQLEGAHTYWRLDRVDTRFYASGFTYWPKAYDVHKTYTPDWTFNETKSNRAGVNLKYDISEAISLRSAYLYKKDTREFIIIYPINSPAGWSMYSPSKQSPYDTVSQGAYAYLDAGFATGGIEHKLTLGGSWDTFKEVRHTVGNIPPLNANGTAYAIPTRLTVDQLLNLPRPTYTTNIGPRYTANRATNTNAVIGDDVTFSDQFSALIGANYSTIESRAFSTAGLQTSGYKKSALTPTVSLIFKPVPKLTTYVSYMEGLEAGTIVPNDPVLYTNPGVVLDPVISRQYEIGAKYAFSDNLLLTSALFRIEKANSYNEIGSDGRITINQDGRQVHQGLEVTLTGKVTDNLSLVVGGTVMDLKIAKATNAALRGKKPIGASPVMLKASLDYELPWVEGLSLSGGVYHSGVKYQDALNLNKIAGYTIFDAGIRYRTEALGRPVTLNLYASNLTDADYWSSYWQLGMPRNIAFSVRTEF